MSSRAWHYREAERLLDEFFTEPVRGIFTITPTKLTAAAIHARLATADREVETEAAEL